MEIPDNIHALADKHANLLKRLDFDPTIHDPSQLDHPDVFLESGFFTTEAVGKIFGGDKGTTDTAPIDADPEDGLILIRPELTHITPLFEAFISGHFTVTSSTSIEVTPEMYFELYEEAITTKESPLSRFSRAASFVGSICVVVTFSGCTEGQGDKPTADYAYSQLKGRQAVATAGTLRGDVVYQEAIRLGFHNLENREIAQAVDPCGAYREIVRTSEWGYLRQLAHPLLFFTGVGVHVPNYSELGKDARALGI